MNNQAARKVRNNRGTAWAGAGLALVMAFTGCGAIAEKATERAFEEAIEAGLEADTGEKVEIDLDPSNGSFSVSGEDGEEFSISVDEEAGTVSMEADGEEVVMSVDEEEGTVTIEGEGADGSTTMQFGGDDLPENWPDWMPGVDGDVISSSEFGIDGDRMMFAAFDTDDAMGAGSEVAAHLRANGFTEQAHSEASVDGATYETWTLTSGEFDVNIVATDSDTDYDQPLSVNIMTADG